MIKAQLLRMQGEALVVTNLTTIFSITHDRPTFISKVHSDLVLAAGQQMNLKQRPFPHCLDHFVFGFRKLTLSLISR
jgi:hypothetical protein